MLPLYHHICHLPSPQPLTATLAMTNLISISNFAIKKITLMEQYEFNRGVQPFWDLWDTLEEEGLSWATN